MDMCKLRSLGQVQTCLVQLSVHPVPGGPRETPRETACKAVSRKAEERWLQEDEAAVAAGIMVPPRHALEVTAVGWQCVVCGGRWDGRLRNVPTECPGPDGRAPADSMAGLLGVCTDA